MGFNKIYRDVAEHGLITGIGNVGWIARGGTQNRRVSDRRDVHRSGYTTQSHGVGGAVTGTAIVFGGDECEVAGAGRGFLAGVTIGHAFQHRRQFSIVPFTGQGKDQITSTIDDCKTVVSVQISRALLNRDINTADVQKFIRCVCESTDANDHFFEVLVGLACVGGDVGEHINRSRVLDVGRGVTGRI